MAFKRFTKENPHSHPMQRVTYHIPMSRVSDFGMKTFGHDTNMYGDVVNKLGRYEDLGEPEEIARKLGVLNHGQFYNKKIAHPLELDMLNDLSHTEKYLHRYYIICAVKGQEIRGTNPIFKLDKIIKVRTRWYGSKEEND